MDSLPNPSPPNLTTSEMPRSEYLDHLDPIAREDVGGLLKAQGSYADSWKRRGGVGSFMMLARKWDRMENHLRIGEEDGEPIYKSIFLAIRDDVRPEGIIDDIRDLRRYLALVEAECRARGYPSALSKQRDNI